MAELKTAETKAAEQKSGHTDGVLVRGADGNLYFIPNKILTSFKVPEQGVATLEAKLPNGAMATSASVPTEWMLHVGACVIQHG